MADECNQEGDPSSSSRTRLHRIMAKADIYHNCGGSVSYIDGWVEDEVTNLERALAPFLDSLPDWKYEALLAEVKRE